jgi:hypothetical protein
LLDLEKDVGPALVSVCDYTDAMYFAKASEIVRREIFAEQNKLSGHFDRDSVVDSVPRCLVELVLIIEHGRIFNSNLFFRRVLLNVELVSNCLSLDSYKLHMSASLNITHSVLPRCVSTT